MIYLIGGAPRTGKTTLAKHLSKTLGVPWVSADTLESVAREYVPQKELSKKYPYTALRRKGGERNNDEFYTQHSTAEIIKVLRSQANTNMPAIRAFIECELANEHSFIVEGYHLRPSMVAKLMEEHGGQNIRAIFLCRFDVKKFAQDARKNSSPNDWLILLTHVEKTFEFVGNMVAVWSRMIVKEADKYSMQTVDMDKSFTRGIRLATRILRKK